MISAIAKMSIKNYIFSVSHRFNIKIQCLLCEPNSPSLKTKAGTLPESQIALS